MITDEYKQQLQKEHDGSNWGSTGAKYSGSDVVQLLEARPYINSVLDFGAGKMSMRQYIRANCNRHIEYTGYDPGIPEMSKLPAEPSDLVLSTDVMEHVEESEVPAVIAKQFELARQLVFADIACYPAVGTFADGPYKGQNLHITIKPPEWWREQFDKYKPEKWGFYEYRVTEKVSNKGPRPRCMLVYERLA